MPGGFRYARTDLVELGRRTASPDAPCWGTERETGAGPLLGFTHAPIRVRFGADEPVVLSSATLATPGSEAPFVSRPLGDRGEDTTFIRFRGDTLARLFAHHDRSAIDRPERPSPRHVMPAEPAAASIVRRVSAAVFETDTPIDPLWLDEVILAAADRAVAHAHQSCAGRQARAPRPADHVGAEAVRHVCAHIASRYAEPLGIADLAAIAGYAPGHFCRKFRAHTGVSVHAYVTTVRLLAAVERLPGCHGAVARLAHETGFASHSHLTNVCTRVLGAPPSRIRDDHAAWCAEMLSGRLALRT